MTAIPAINIARSQDFTGVVNVKDPTYGAVGDGIADDTAAINAAEAHAAAVGRALHFPGGTSKYKCLGQIVMGSGPRYWFGDDFNLSALSFPTDAGTNGSTFAINTTAATYFIFRDLGFFGPGLTPGTLTPGTKPCNLSLLKTKAKSQFWRCNFQWFYDGTSVNGDHEEFHSCFWGNNHHNVHYLAGPPTRGNQHYLLCDFNPPSFSGIHLEAGNSLEGCEFIASHWFGNPYPIYQVPGGDGFRSFMLGNKFDRCALEAPGNAYIYVPDGTGSFGFNNFHNLNCGPLSPTYNIASEPNDYSVKVGSALNNNIVGDQSTFAYPATGGGYFFGGLQIKDLLWESVHFAIDSAQGSTRSVVEFTPGVSGVSNCRGTYHNQSFVFAGYTNGPAINRYDLVAGYDFFGAFFAPQGADVPFKGGSWPAGGVALADCPATVGKTAPIMLPGNKIVINTAAADGAITNLQWLAADLSNPGKVKAAQLGADTIIGWAVQQSVGGKVDSFLFPSAPTMGGAACVATSLVPVTGLQTIDGYVLQDNDRVLLVGQTTPAQNGLWVVHAGVWTRPSDYASSQLAGSREVVVRGGTLFAGSTWALVTTGTIVIDATDTAWVNTNGGTLVAHLADLGNLTGKTSGQVDTTYQTVTGLAAVNGAIARDATNHRVVWRDGGVWQFIVTGGTY